MLNTEAMNTMKSFDYSGLDSFDRLLAQGCATEVKEFVRRSTCDAHRIGLKLLKVKERLGHGRFLAWLEAELGASADTAERLMKVATRFPQIPHGAEIGLTALYLLAANGVGGAARGEAVERARRGEAITAAKAREIVARHQAGESLLDGTTPRSARNDATTNHTAATDVATNDPVAKDAKAAPAKRKARPAVVPLTGPEGQFDFDADPVVEDNTGAGDPEYPMRELADHDFCALIETLFGPSSVHDAAAETAAWSLTRRWSRRHKREVADSVEWAAGVLHRLARRLRSPDKDGAR